MFEQLPDICAAASINNATTVPEFLDGCFATWGDQPAYLCGQQLVTYADVDERSATLCAWLLSAAGIRKGERVAIQLSNCIEYPIISYAIMRSGAVLVNINPHYTGPEINHVLKDSGARLVFCQADNAAHVSGALDGTAVERLVTLGEPAEDHDTGAGQDIQVPLSQVMVDAASAAATLIQRPPVSADDMLMLQYTGGTTGPSKGAIITHGSALANIHQSARNLSVINPLEVAVCPLPMYHIYAFSIHLMMFFAQGVVTLVISDPQNPESFVSSMKGLRVSGFSGINSLFLGLSAHPGFRSLDFTGLKMTISGGAPLNDSVARAWAEVTGCSITEGYGMTEASPVISFNMPGQEKIGSVGQLVPGTELRLLDADGREVAKGEDGEIVVRGPQLMAGYWQQPEETEKTLAGGWLHTGDMGRLDEDGFLHIVDRKKDMVIVSGFNVFPTEIENVLTGHPAIADCAVIGVPDMRTGERVAAFVVVRDGERLSGDEVMDWARQSLTRYKVPREIIFTEALPKSAVGKVLRRELRTASGEV